MKMTTTEDHIISFIYFFFDFSESFEQEKQQKPSRRFPIPFSGSPLLGKKMNNRNSGSNNNGKKSEQSTGTY